MRPDPGRDHRAGRNNKLSLAAHRSRSEDFLGVRKPVRIVVSIGISPIDEVARLILVLLRPVVAHRVEGAVGDGDRARGRLSQADTERRLAS